MYAISQLEKKQIGVRLPKYLINEIDELTKQSSVNRTDIIVEALRVYIEKQKTDSLHQRLNNSIKEAKKMIHGKMPETSLKDLIDELQDSSDSTV